MSTFHQVCRLISFCYLVGFGWSFVSHRTKSRRFLLASERNDAKIVDNVDSASKCDYDIRFQYSPYSLLHLKALELPNEKQKWSKQKSIAIVMSFLISFSVSIILDQVWHGSSFFFSGPSAMIGWFLFGGAEVREENLPKNGGSDGKFVMDRPSRLSRIIEDLPPSVVTLKSSTEMELSELERLAGLVHTEEYIQRLKSASEAAAAADRPMRLVPTYYRTLVDKYSYEAALSSISEWKNSVDAALSGSTPIFALVRPPGHHACRASGMGGCLLNSAAIGAMYALECGAKNVGILDLDAHHGNGIAHCIQDEPRIRYVSLHEDPESWGNRAYAGRKDRTERDPRGPEASDMGPSGNCLNVLLRLKTNWNTGYKDALENKAIPWLINSDVVLIALGFDALEKDTTSSFRLQPEDYAEMSLLLKKTFGNRLAFGLEGGYCWMDGELSRAVVEFIKPYKKA